MPRPPSESPRPSESPPPAPRPRTAPSTRPAFAWFTMPLRAAREVLAAFYDNGLGGLVPLVIVLLVLAVVLSVLTLAGPIIPFIYPLF
jgi:hypothetical protein